MKYFQVDLKCQRYFSFHIFLFGDKEVFFCYEISNVHLMNLFGLNHSRCNNGDADVERTPRLQDIEDRSPVATDISLTNSSDSSTAKRSASGVSRFLGDNHYKG